VCAIEALVVIVMMAYFATHVGWFSLWSQLSIQLLNSSAGAGIVVLMVLIVLDQLATRGRIVFACFSGGHVMPPDVPPIGAQSMGRIEVTCGCDLFCRCSTRCYNMFRDQSFSQAWAHCRGMPPRSRDCLPLRLHACCVFFLVDASGMVAFEY